MDLRQLAVFVAVAEEQSFSRAADRLHVVQSAVSATVRKLEREWQVRLFDRTTHAVSLSADGRALLAGARAALAAADAVEHAVDEVRGGLRGTVRVGIMQATLRPGGISVAKAIAAFRAQYPEVSIEVRQASSIDLAAAVVSGELDASFIALPDRELRGLRLSMIADPEMQFACHRDHPLAGRASVDLRTVAGEAFAELPPSWGVRIANDRAFAAAGVTRTVAYEINDVATVVDFVANGIAVTIMSPISAVQDARVAFVAIRRHAPRFRVSLATADARPVSPATRRFVEIASEHART